MMDLRLTHFFKENPAHQLQMIARRKPSILFGIMGVSLALTLSLPILGFSLGALSYMLLNVGTFLSGIALAKEYARILHIYQKPAEKKLNIKPQKVIINQKLIAEINGKDGLPVCTIHTTDPLLAGRAVAQLMPEQIVETLDRFYELLPTTMQLLHLGTSSFKWNIHQFIDDEIKRLKPTIPDYIQKQLEGMIMEMEDWIKKDNQRWVYQRPIPTVEDMIKFILIPDICKMLGCSAVIKGKDNHTELWRNLDWPSLGVIDTQSMMLITKLASSKAHQPKATASITFTPGVAGLSLTNDKGLTVTINEATTMQTKRHNIGGIPEILHTREIVRNCSTLKDVENFLNKSKPLTSHILTVMDGAGQGAIFQILPPKSKAAYTQRKLKKSDDHIKVTNHHLDKHGAVIEGSVSWPDSLHRFQQLQDALDRGLNGYKTLRNAQQRATTHCIIFSNHKDSQGKLKQEVRLRAHSAFSANKEIPFSYINVSQAFKRLTKS